MALLRHTVFLLPSLSLSLSLSLSFLMISHFSSRSLQFSTRISFRFSALTRYLFSLASFTFILRFLIFSSVSSLSYRFLSFFFAFSSPTLSPHLFIFSFFLFFFLHTYVSSSPPPNIFSFFLYAHFLFVSLSLSL